MAEPSPALVRRAQAGDRDALSALVQSQQTYVYSMPYSTTESFPATCPSAAAGRMPRPVRRWYTSRNGLGLMVEDNMITVIWPRTLRAGRTPRLASSLLSIDDPDRLSCGYQPRWALNWLTL